MRSYNSILTFHSYVIDEIAFKQNLNYNKDGQIQLEIDFDVKKEFDGDNITIKLICKIFDENFIENGDPFYIKASIIGKFSIENFNKNDEMHKHLAEANSIAILFPYLRSAINHTCLEGQNINPFVIQPINITELLKDKEKIAK